MDRAGSTELSKKIISYLYSIHLFLDFESDWIKN
jgi:hypothetical protein